MMIIHAYTSLMLMMMMTTMSFGVYVSSVPLDPT